MTRILPRVRPWLPSAKRGGDSRIRVLGGAESAALRALLDSDPAANIFTRSQLERGNAPQGAYSNVVGIEGEQGLESACWIGANIAPTAMSEDHARAYAEYALRSRQRFASVFGPAQAVMAMHQVMAAGPQPIFDVRPNQPLMSLREAPRGERLPLRRARLQDYDRVLPASAKMFEEELGYSPLQSGGGYYRSRVRQLIQDGHTLIDLDQRGKIIFKADLGTVTQGVAQIQGVWIDPAHRGYGLAAGYMASVVDYALTLVPEVTLYVNDYNEPALRSYQRVGFEHVGTFATILF